MTAEQLKASILQMAIEGKLVPQIDDEPAVDIEAVEPEEVPFAIPDKWKWVRLKELVSIATGKKDANYGTPDGEYPFFTCSSKPIKAKNYSYDGDYLIMPGNGANIGLVIHYSGKFEAYQRTYIIKAENDNISLRYLKYHLEYNWKEYNSSKMYGSAIPFIKLGNLQNYPVALPPLSEQHRIVARLNEILPLIEEYGKAHSALKNAEQALPDQLRASLLQEAIQGKLVPQLDDEPAVDMAGEEPDEVPFAIPEKWKWVKLGDIGESNIGLTYKPQDVTSDGSGIPVLRSSNIQNGKLDFADIKRVSITNLPQKVFVQEGDLLICARNGSASLVGKAALVENCQEPMAFGAFMAIFRSRYNKYVYYFLASEVFRSSLKGVGTTTINQITQKMLLNALIPLPPLAEQRRIVARLEELLPHVDAIAGLR